MYNLHVEGLGKKGHTYWNFEHNKLRDIRVRS